jgi:hypothetical protein
MIEQSYGRYIRKDFLGPLIAAGAKSQRKVAVGEKTGPPLGVLGKRPGFPKGILVEAGGIEPPSEDSPAMATTRVVRDL